jgi:hypothetical protein
MRAGVGSFRPLSSCPWRPARHPGAGRPPLASGAVLDLGGLARLLFFAAGVTGSCTGCGSARPLGRRLYPIELYAVCGPLPACLPGCTASSRPSSPCGGCVAATSGPAWPPPPLEAAIAGLPLCLVLTGIPWRTTWKYRERGYRHLFWDAGAIVANLLAVAAAAGWDARVLLGFVDPEVAGLLGLGEPEEYPLALVTVAAPAAAEPTGSPLLEPISHGRGRCHAGRAATRWSPASSASVRCPAPRRSVSGAARPADSGPSPRAGRLQRVTPAPRTLPPTRSRR